MNIVTHRFRGFDLNENSSTGFLNALLAGVKYFEFDIRLTADRIPVVNHDNSTQNQFNSKIDINKSEYRALKRLKYKKSDAPGIMTLEECLDIFSERKRNSSKVFIDIKDFGEEKRIYQSLSKRSLLDNSIIVSWLPEVLFEFHRIDPNLPLCFSHNFIQNKFRYLIEKILFGNRIIKQFLALLLKPFNGKYADFLRNTTFFFDDYNKLETPGNMGNKLYSDSEHILSTPVSGRLLEIILKSRGFVCIEYRSIPGNYQQLYSKSPGIIPYSINSQSELKLFLLKIKPDFILSDEPALVSKFD